MTVSLPKATRAITSPRAESKPAAASLLARYRIGVALLALSLVGLVLRIYDLAVMGWIPDSYEQMEATQRLLRGDLPLSAIYQPGMAFVLAPFFALLPDSVGTMQLVITFAGVALVPAAYALTLRVSGDRISALLAALLVAVSMTFVHYSRDGHFDVIYTLLLVTALLGVSDLQRRSLVYLLGYGALLALLANLRLTNLAIVPALLLIWLRPLDVPLSLRTLLREFVLTRALVVPAVFVVLMLASVRFSGWYGGASASPHPEHYGEYLLIYGFVLVNGLSGLVLVLPLAMAGGLRLWRRDRSLTAAMGGIIMLWPLIFASFVFQDPRYMLPPLFLVQVLAAIGASGIWPGKVPAELSRRILRVYAPAAAVFFMIAFTAYASVALVANWDETASRSDEGMFREVRPAVAAIEADALLVTAMAQGLGSGAGSSERADLVRHWLSYGSGVESVERVVLSVQEALAAERKVYYLYSRYEAGDDLEGEGRQGFRRFFDAIEQRFELRPVFVSEGLSLGSNRWVLYEVSAEP